MSLLKHGCLYTVVAMGPAHVGTSIGDCLNLLYKHFFNSLDKDTSDIDIVT